MSLKDMIIDASQKYYSTGDSPLSDAEFDAALEELKKEEPNSPILTAVGHGYDVDKDSTSGEKIPHKYGIAVSLNKCHNWKEYPKDIKANKVVHSSLKLDGISVVLYYESGHLYSALTRGDGTVGIDVTNKVKLIAPDYENVDESFTGAVRGEILMAYDKFEAYQGTHSEVKNPRNTTAGLMNSKYTPDEEFKFLSIVVYTVVGCEDSRFSTYSQVKEWISANFATCAPWTSYKNSESSFEDDMVQLVNDLKNNYPYDGIVLSSDNLTVTGNRIDYNSIAYKFEAESTNTEVIDIAWELSKTKYMIPRVHVNTVQLSGTDVSYCSGFNAKFIKDSKLGPGAVVRIMKANEIIPDIQEIVTPSEECSLPETCPCCETKLEWSGVHLKCPNSECADAAVQDMLIWISKIAPYDGLGGALKLKFLSGMNIDSVDKIYIHGPIEYAETDSIQYNNFQKMFNMLFTNKVELKDAIAALNVPRFGEVTSKKFAQYPDKVKSVVMSFDNPDAEYSTLLGAANYASLVAHKDKFAKLQYIFHNIDWETATSADSFKKVSITGKLSVKRAAFEEELKSFGYIASDIVNKDTFALITDDPNSSSSKNKKADELGISKLSEQEFRKEYLS